MDASQSREIPQRNRQSGNISHFKYSEKTIFILGAPRSGTSWLGKIFDSHPDVLYRHEPDILVRGEHMPFMCDSGSIRTHRAAAQLWLNRLATTRKLKSAGTSPIFAKSFHGTAELVQRRGIITALKLLGQTQFGRRFANAIDVPDFVDPAAEICKRLVIKSVSSMGRAGLIAAATPESRVILILRHPCGQVASMRRGVSAAKFEHDIPIRELAQSPLASRFDLTEEKLVAAPFVGQLAWSWVIQNETAIEALDAAPNVKLISYADMAANPESMMRCLFQFSGLDWRPEVSNFLVASTRANGREGYYQIRRDPIQAATKWRHELSNSEIEIILNIAKQSRAGRLVLDDKGAYRLTEIPTAFTHESRDVR